MIPYDDLVAALQAWRARQGLPVSTQAVAANAPNHPPAPRTAPPAPPPAPVQRTTAPQPAQRTTAPQPAPLAPVDTTTDENLDHIDPSLIEEAHYENEGDDFAMAFGNDAGPASGEETLAGEDVPHNTREDW